MSASAAAATLLVAVKLGTGEATILLTGRIFIVGGDHLLASDLGLRPGPDVSWIRTTVEFLTSTTRPTTTGRGRRSIR